MKQAAYTLQIFYMKLMLDDTLNLHKSQSTGKEIKLVDMHLPHLLRAYSRLTYYGDGREGYNDGWNDALNSLKK